MAAAKSATGIMTDVSTLGSTVGSAVAIAGLPPFFSPRHRLALLPYHPGHATWNILDAFDVTFVCIRKYLFHPYFGYVLTMVVINFGYVILMFSRLFPSIHSWCSTCRGTILPSYSSAKPAVK